MSSQKELLPDEGEVVVWTVYHVVITLLSLSGDVIILVGTYKYKAIKMNRVIVVIIQHLAAADLLMTFTRVVPIIVSLIGEGWILGTFLCFVNMGLAYVTGPTMSVLTCVLSTTKLITLQYPLRARTWSTKRGHVISLLAWFSSFLTPTQVVNMIITTEKSLYFDYIHYNCYVDHTHSGIPIWLMNLQYISVAIIFSIKVSLMIITTVLLFYKASKAADKRGRSLRWQGVLPVTLTTGVFLATYLPDVVMNLIVYYHYRNVGGPSGTTRRAVSFLENINIVTNFFIYSLTVPSFREFLSVKFHEMVQNITALAAKESAKTHPGAGSSKAKV